MSVRTLRFNKQEESMLKQLLGHTAKDFSTSVKDLIAEKLEDLQDIGRILRIRESKKSDYVTADKIESNYPRPNSSRR